MEYIIVNEIIAEQLVVSVNNKISEGFKPIGGVTNVQQSYYQAMVKVKATIEEVIL